VGSPAAAAPGSTREPTHAHYIIGDDGITLCREAPTAVDQGEIVVASNEELHAARLGIPTPSRRSGNTANRFRDAQAAQLSTT
jgi:hypothetical protein